MIQPVNLADFNSIWPWLWIGLSAVLVVILCFGSSGRAPKPPGRPSDDLSFSNVYHRCRHCRRWFNGLGECSYFEEENTGNTFDRVKVITCAECYTKETNNRWN